MEEYTRRLIHVPIIHSPADMGSMGAELAAACIERLGRRHWDDYVAMLATFWQLIRAGLDGLGLDYGRVDLYQDGLPVCGKELEIVKVAAAKGSDNHQLVLDLISRGATLMGTEDPKLLLEEYRNVRAELARRCSEPRAQARGHVTGLAPGAPSPPPRRAARQRLTTTGVVKGQGSSDEGSAGYVDQAARTRGLMAERDAYLGRRIHESLRPGRTGILFLGLMHNVESYLAEDIVVTRLVEKSKRQNVEKSKR
jgi:hypothetical protein